jgi:uncharacterized protein YlxW (UPF0749 family)
MLLALALKTQLSIRRSAGLPSNRLPALAAAFREQRDENENLKKTIEKQQLKMSKLQKSITEGSSQASVLKDEMQSLQLLAGLTPAEGPGVIVTLRDSPRKIPANTPPEVADLYIVHDSEIWRLISELRSAGAEVISVNDQRIITTTAIRCVGPTILINEKRFAPPFEVRAIGQPDTLYGALKLPGGINDDFDPFGMISMRKVNRVFVPGYPGVPILKYAKIATEGE